jgi:hypothetical protein
MTPAQLLEEAKDQFIILFHNEESKLTSLLRKALGDFQDNAGAMASLLVEDKGSAKQFSLPPHFLSTAVATDSDGEWVFVEEFIEANTNEKKLRAEVDATTKFPVSVKYFLDIQHWPLDEDLPNGVINPTLDYLVALIAIPNTERERAVMLANGSPVELPTKAELEEKCDKIKESLSDRAFQLPVVAVSTTMG